MGRKSIKRSSLTKSDWLIISLIVTVTGMTIMWHLHGPGWAIIEALFIFGGCWLFFYPKDNK